MSDKTLTEGLGCLFDLPDWVELLRRLDILWQAHKQAQLERGMEETVFSANTELAQALADLHVENATLTADNETLEETLEERVADLKMMTGLCRKCLAKNVALEARTRMPDGWLETLGGDADA